MLPRGLTGRAAAVLAAGFLVLFVAGGSRFAIGLTLKPMAEELGWSRGTLGLAVAAFFAVSAGCMFVSGRLADCFSPRLVLGGGLAASALGIGLMGTVTAPWQAFVLYGGVFAMGSGVASIVPIGVMVSRWFPGRTGLATAVAISGMSVGQLVMIAAMAVVLVEVGWRSVYGWLGIVNLVLVPVVILAIAHDRGHHAAAAVAPEADAGMGMGEAARTRHFWLLAAVFSICGFQDFFVATHLVAFAQDSGVEALLAGNLLALMGLTGLMGVIVAGVWSDRSGPMWPMLACFAVRVAGFALILVSHDTPAVIAFALLYGSTFLMTAPLTVIFTREAFGRAHLGALTGLITMIHHVSGGVGAYAGAVLFDTQGSYEAAFALMLALSLAAAGITASLRRPRA
jgi:MFS family permease